jgi:predicted CoA-binding protein
MKATRASIEAFLSSPRIAIAGVSRDPKKFGYQVYKELKDKGLDVYPVNPETDTIQGTPCFRSVAVLPLNVHSLLIVTSKKKTREVVAAALAKGIDNIWIQQMSETPEALELAKSQPVNLVTGECILMHTDPVKGVHRFHRAIRTFFGRMPK